MKTNRRKFLQYSGLTGIGLVGAGALKSYAAKEQVHTQNFTQQFNMSGYVAPKLETVRIGFIGLGNRGPGAVERMTHIDGVSIKALCDIRSEKVNAVKKSLEGSKHTPAIYTGKEDEWKKLCERADIDLVYIATPWSLHTPMALYAMQQGKHVCVEVPAAKTIDECWQLVETSERTKKHCIILENCCYDFFEQLTLNMTRNGMFGELVHAEGAYIHDLTRDWLFNKNAYADMWRLKENASRNGNLYPTHGLGPIAQCMNINRGDRMDHLVSMSTNDFTMNNIANEMAAKDPFFQEFTNKPFRGNMNTTLIRTYRGKSLMIQHDVSSPRPYSRIHVLSGTKGSVGKWPSPERVAFGHSWIKKEELDDLYKKYSTPIVNHIGAIAKDVGGHGGMDFIMDWRLIDCLRNGLPLDQDVYDAALWSSISPLSEKSVSSRSKTMDIPDFTRGNWKTNQPVSLSLEGGATTKVRSIKPDHQL